MVRLVILVVVVLHTRLIVACSCCGCCSRQFMIWRAKALSLLHLFRTLLRVVVPHCLFSLFRPLFKQVYCCRNTVATFHERRFCRTHSRRPICLRICKCSPSLWQSTLWFWPVLCCSKSTIFFFVAEFHVWLATIWLFGFPRVVVASSTVAAPTG